MLAQILSRYHSHEFTNLSRSDLITALGKLTSDSKIFQRSHSLGFYSHSPLCINININSGELIIWRILYILLIGGIIAGIIASYVIITYTTKQSAPSVQAGIEGSSAEKKERENFMSFKVTTIIISQMLCWTPILIASVLSLLNVQMRGSFYELAAIVILPINSIVNPILYSTLFKIMFTKIKDPLLTVFTETLRTVRSKQASMQGAVEAAVESSVAGVEIEMVSCTVSSPEQI